MADSIRNSDAFRNGLSDQEKPWYDMFLKAEGREPSSMWELMGWSIHKKQAASKFIEGLFGL